MLRAISLASLLVVASSQASTISSLSPSTVVAGSETFWLTVNGSGFAPGSVVRIDGAERTTTFLSSAKIAASINSHDISRVGARQVSVQTPTGDASPALPLTIVAPPPAPKLISISPTVVATGGPAFKLTVDGSGFAANSLIDIDGTTRATFDATSTSLTTEVPAQERNAPGARRIRVVTPPPGGGVSEAVELTVRPGESTSQTIAVKAAALAGVRAAAIVVNPFHEDAKKNGLSEAALRAIAESKLKTAGVRILSNDEYRAQSSDQPYVLISLNALVSTPGESYIFSVAVSVRRMIRSPLNKEMVPAVLWEAGGVGGGTGGGMQKNAEDYLSDIVDQLAADLLTANPRK